MMGVLLSLIPLIGWGAGDYVASLGTKKINTFSISLYFSIAGFIVTVPIALAISRPEIYAKETLIFMLASLCFTAGFLTMLRGFMYGPVGIVAPIANSYALVTTLFAILFQNASFSFGALAGILIIVIGIVLVSYSKPEKGEFKNMSKTIFLAVSALCVFGVAFILLDKASVQAWNQNLTIVQTTGLVASIFYWLLLQKKNRVKDVVIAAKMPIYFIGGAAGGVGLLGMTAALEHAGNVAIPTAIAAASPLVTALLAYKFDKEHLTGLQRSATILIVAGIILLAVS